MYSTIMRDSSQDYRTYWIRNGNYYGKARSLGSAPCQLPADKVAQIPEPDRQMILDEVKGNPSFCATLARAMNEDRDWQAKIAASAKRAIVNQLDPSRFPESRGKWPKLRARVDELVSAARNAVKSSLSSMSLKEKVEAVKILARGGQVAVPAVAGLGDLGNLGFFDVLASLVGTIGKVGAEVYTKDLVADTQKDIAKIQANAAMQTASAQQSIANAQAAIAAAQAQQAAAQNPVGSAISKLTTGEVGGIPIMLIAIPVIGAVIYFLMKK